MNRSLLEYYGTNNDKEILIVTFGGSNSSTFGMLPFEFRNCLTKWFPSIDKKFYRDLHQCWYQRGIEGISTNIEDTKVYLEKVIDGYKKVIFMGTSAGGYAAILFGSLLNVSHVIAFSPQSIINKKYTPYNNLKHIINKTTNYHLYCNTAILDPHDVHHRSQVDNLNEFENVKAVYKNDMVVRRMRNNGELKAIFELTIMN
jgi:predicted esterase YcpF (UPF0227 family)